MSLDIYFVYTITCFSYNSYAAFIYDKNSFYLDSLV